MRAKLTQGLVRDLSNSLLSSFLLQDDGGSTAPPPPPPAPLESYFAGGVAGGYWPWRIGENLWQDDAKTISANTLDNPVRVVADLSGNGHDMVAPSDAARPLLKFPAENRYSGQFDSVDDKLVSNLVISDFNGWTIAVRARRTDTNWGVIIGNITGGAWSAGALIFSRSVSGVAYASVGVYGEYLTYADTITTSRQMLLIGESATSFIARMDGVQSDSAILTQVPSSSVFVIGCENDNFNFFGGFVFDAIIINRTDAAMIAAIEALL
jgi:hypothetical protein